MEKETISIAYGKDGLCELCGKNDDLRPYGAGGEWICFKCGMKNKEKTIDKFYEILGRGGIIVVGARK